MRLPYQQLYNLATLLWLLAISHLDASNFIYFFFALRYLWHMANKLRIRHVVLRQKCKRKLPSEIQFHNKWTAKQMSIYDKEEASVCEHRERKGDVKEEDEREYKNGN